MQSLEKPTGITISYSGASVCFGSGGVLALKQRPAWLMVKLRQHWALDRGAGMCAAPGVGLTTLCSVTRCWPEAVAHIAGLEAPAAVDLYARLPCRPTHASHSHNARHVNGSPAQGPHPPTHAVPAALAKPSSARGTCPLPQARHFHQTSVALPRRCETCRVRLPLCSCRLYSPFRL